MPVSRRPDGGIENGLPAQLLKAMGDEPVPQVVRRRAGVRPPAEIGDIARSEPVDRLGDIGVGGVCSQAGAPRTLKHHV